MRVICINVTDNRLLTLGAEYTVIEDGKCECGIRRFVLMEVPKPAYVIGTFCCTCNELLHRTHRAFYAWRFVPKPPPDMVDEDCDVTERLTEHV